MRLDLQQPRGLADLFRVAASLYRRYLGQFLILAGVLVVPFEIALLALTDSVHGGHLTTHQDRLVLLFGGADFVLLIPLVSGLLARAVLLIGQGEQPGVIDVFRASLPVLATVVAASIIAAIGSAVACFPLVIPGVWLWLRLYVVAQTAAIEGADWPSTLRRGFALTRGSAWRILGMLLIIALINLALSSVLVDAASSNSAAADVLEVVAALFSQSFSALLGALLYFDLRARDQST